MKINNNLNTENINRKSFKGEAPEPMDKMQNFLNKFIEEAGQYMKDEGPFREISASYDNDNPLRYVGKIGLRIMPAGSSIQSKERILEAFVTDENNRYESPKLIMHGNREKIMECLKSGDFKETLTNIVTQKSDKFYNDDKI